MVEQHIARERFRGFVELSGIDGRYISRAEERRLLEHGMCHFALDPDVARGIVLDFVQVNDYQLERDIDRRMVQVLALNGGTSRKISRSEFKEAARLYKTLAGGSLSDEEARVRVKQVMETNQFRPKRGGLTFSRRWYNSVGERNRQSRILALLSRDM